jgi:hypothetical protein
LYRATVNDLSDKKLVYFETVTDTDTNQLENSKETRYFFVGSIDYHIDRVWRSDLYQRKTNENLPEAWIGHRDSFLGPLDPRTLLHATSAYRDIGDQIYQPPMTQSPRKRILQSHSRRRRCGLRDKNSNNDFTYAE